MKISNNFVITAYLYVVLLCTCFLTGSAIEEKKHHKQWELICLQTLKTQTQTTLKETAPTTTSIKYKVTAYCPCEKCCGKFADGITASGYKICPGDKFCASPLPFLTIFDIPGYGITINLDRGGAIKENCIDVFFPTHKEALEWGVQYLEVKVIK